MIRTTVDSIECFLLTAGPTGGAVEVGFSLPVDIAESKTRREERTAMGATLRTRLKWTAVLQRGAANALRAALCLHGRQLFNQPCRGLINFDEALRGEVSAPQLVRNHPAPVGATAVPSRESHADAQLVRAAPS